MKKFTDMFVGAKDPVVAPRMANTQANNAAALQRPIEHRPIPRSVTFDLIRQIIVDVRVDDVIGKGKITKDEYLADRLFSTVRHLASESTLTYDEVFKNIQFVKSTDWMGAGKWGKEDHLAEYMFAKFQLSMVKKKQAEKPVATEPKE